MLILETDWKTFKSGKYSCGGGNRGRGPIMGVLQAVVLRANPSSHENPGRGAGKAFKGGTNVVKSMFGEYRSGHLLENEAQSSRDPGGGYLMSFLAGGGGGGGGHSR
uniref:Uncharacterized protein n=1 Tax=Mustela putorius furo TaxID=9669 RepID=M3YTJ7_MUSPF